MNTGKYQLLRSLPLEMKINVSLKVLRNAEIKYDNNVYISTGGVDSTLLSWLCDKIPEYNNIPRVCVGTLEPFENTKFNRNRGDILIKSETSKIEVIKQYGYPIISKENAMKISRYNNSKLEWAKDRRLNGYMGNNGKWCYDSRISLKWQYLIYAPFQISEKCCDITKKKPLKDYEKKTKRVAITGEMATESNNRFREYMKNGCFQIGKREKVTPLGFWDTNDIKQCIKKYNIPISKEYGEVVETDNVLMFSGEQRTGCDICGFGIQYDTDRFERLKVKNEKLYSFITGGGEWVRKDKYRFVKFRRNSIPIWSNLYFQPNNKGYGYKFILKYLEL